MKLRLLCLAGIIISGSIAATRWQDFRSSADAGKVPKVVAPASTQPQGAKKSALSDTKAAPQLRPGTEAALLAKSEGEHELSQLLATFDTKLSLEDAQWFLDATKNRVASADGTWGLRDAHWIRCLERWAGGSPWLAADLLEKTCRLRATGDPVKEGTILMQAWAAKDPAGAIAWATAQVSLEKSYDRTSWLEREKVMLTTGWAKFDLDGLMSYLGTGGKHVAAHFAAEIFKKERNLAALQSWLDAATPLLPEIARSEIANLIANEISTASGVPAAVEWARSRTHPKEMEAVAATLISRYAQLSPAPAMEWLQSISKHQKVAMTSWDSAMSHWVDKDPEAAGQWLKGQTNSPAAAPLIWSYAMGIVGDDPAAARAWAAKLPPGDEKDSGVWPIYLNHVGASNYSQHTLLQQITYAESAIAAWKSGVNQPSTATHGAVQFMPRVVRASATAPPQFQLARKLFGG